MLYFFSFILLCSWPNTDMSVKRDKISWNDQKFLKFSEIVSKLHENERIGESSLHKFPEIRNFLKNSHVCLHHPNDTIITKKTFTNSFIFMQFWDNFWKFQEFLAISGNFVAFHSHVCICFMFFTISFHSSLFIVFQKNWRNGGRGSFPLLLGVWPSNRLRLNASIPDELS